MVTAMMVYLKRTYLLAVLLLCIGAVQAQKNNYGSRGPVFSYGPRYVLPLFDSVRSIQIEDSFFVNDLRTGSIGINYSAHRYFYDANRKTTRVMQFRAPLDTSYDIEYLNYENDFIKKGTWPTSQRWTEIDSLSKTVISYYAGKGKVEKRSITRYIADFLPVERHDYEDSTEVMVAKREYTTDGKLSLDAYKGLYTSFARSITYKQGRPVEERLYNKVSNINNFENDPMSYWIKAVYGKDSTVVHFTYFEKGKVDLERFAVYNNKGQLIAVREEDQRRVYAYDKNGNEASMIRKDNKGNLIEKTTSYYNERQDIVKKDVIYSGVYTLKTFTYQYDERGNWVKQFQYEFNNLKAIITRKIEYYNSTPIINR